MSNQSTADFRAQLRHELIALEGREAAAADRQGLRFNPYLLAHYMGGLDRVMHLIDEGRTPSDAFRRVFVPTRGMHTVARHLGLGLDVERGKWVVA